MWIFKAIGFAVIAVTAIIDIIELKERINKFRNRDKNK